MPSLLISAANVCAFFFVLVQIDDKRPTVSDLCKQQLLVLAMCVCEGGLQVEVQNNWELKCDVPVRMKRVFGSRMVRAHR